MIGYLNTKNKEECFGCGACYQICSRKAIKMEIDNEGFLYPIINDDLCIKCDLCHRVCPVENENNMKKSEKALVGFNKIDGVRNFSASGGAFHAITKCFEDNAIIYGAEWKERSCVCHSAELAKSAYERFSKSKYIQSEIGQSYIDIKKYLLEGQKVVFTGTPCQNAGLKTFLGKEYENLWCIDLVCHGVPSGKVLESYFQSIESLSNPIKNIEFRYKKYSKGVWESKCARICYESGKERIVDYDSSGFLRGFANGLFFRPSCGICPYAQQNRISDLTIGDAWGIEKIKPELNPHQGVSFILVNTEKGRVLIDEISKYMELETIDMKYAISGNARLRSPDMGHVNRDDFFRRYENDSFERIVQDYIPKVSMARKMAHRIKIRLKKCLK